MPQEFVDNTDINKLITEEGVEPLPATVVDGEIVKTGTYPTNEEIVRFLEVSGDFLGGEPKAPCCCSGGNCDGGSC